MTHTVTPKADPSLPVTTPNTGVLTTAWSAFAISGNLQTGDTWDLCYIPKGANIIGGMISTDELDSHSNPCVQLQVGTESEPAKFLDTENNGDKAKRFMQPLNVSSAVTPGEPMLCRLTCSEGPRTFAAGNVNICFHYVMN